MNADVRGLRLLPRGRRHRRRRRHRRAEVGRAALSSGSRSKVARNRAYYEKARTSLGLEEQRKLPCRSRRSCLRIFYSRLLHAIYDVLGKRVAVLGWRKATLGIGTWVRARLKLPLGR